MALSLIRLHASDQNTLILIKEFVDRAIEFSNEWLDSDADDAHLFVDIMAEFFNPRPTKLLLILQDDDGKTVAHLIAQIENFYGTCYLTINHYWKDSGVELDDQNRWEIWEYIKKWGSQFGVDKVRAFARNVDVAKVLEKYGLMDSGKRIVEADMPKG